MYKFIDDIFVCFLTIINHLIINRFNEFVFWKKLMYSDIVIHLTASLLKV